MNYKRMAVLFMALLMTLPVTQVFAQQNDQINSVIQAELLKRYNSNKNEVKINNITLSVTEDGRIRRVFNGQVTDINFNKIYGKNYRFIKLVNWNNTFSLLVQDKNDGSKKILNSGMGVFWSEISFEYFAESDIVVDYTKIKVNDISVTGDQMYVGCNDGIMLVITPCMKCYKLKKVCDFDIISLSSDGTNIEVNGEAGQIVSVPVNNIRQNNINAETALDMYSKGAVFVDVRTEEEYNEVHFEGSVNIPVDKIAEINKYSKDTVLIFYCKAGGRAEMALKEAEKMGFVNIYNLGSVDKII